MFDSIQSIFAYKLQIKPVTGFLVSQGSIPLDPSEPDISFMRCEVQGVGALPYIPGSSLKGPFRAHTESLLRSLSPALKDQFACNMDEKSTCGQKKDLKKASGFERYKESCLACQMFGSTLMASVIRFEDCYPFSSIEEAKTIFQRLDEAIMVRNGIAIDRNSGKTKEGALFYYESVDLLFYGQVVLKNPELWQVALFLKTIDHINAGFQKIGRSKSRGMGRVEIRPTELTIYTTGQNKILFSELKNGQIAGVEKDFPIKFENDGIVRKATIKNQELSPLNTLLEKRGIDELLTRAKQVS